MELRQLDIYLPREHAKTGEELLHEQTTLGVWREELENKQVLLRALIEEPYTEGLLDLLEKHFSMVEGYRVVLLPVQASLPRVEEETVEATAPAGEAAQPKKRISREELYGTLSAATEVSPVFVALTALATIVAVIGLVRGNIPVIIGAMVLAPLLGPSMAQALGTTLGDLDLIRRGARANAFGMATVLLVSLLLGVFIRVDPELPEIASRTTVTIGDITLALAAGAAGALALTSGVATSVIGVAAALALLPPMVVAGLLIGTGALTAAVGALLLALANVISLNLAAVFTFLLQGIRPAKWWEEYRSRRVIKRAIIFWGVLLIVLTVLAFLIQG